MRPGVLVLGLLFSVPAWAGEVRGADVGALPEAYLIVFRDAAVMTSQADRARATQALANEFAATHGARVNHVYQHALRGFAAELTGAAAARIADDPRVAWVEQDRLTVSLDEASVAQTWNLDRVNQRFLPLDSQAGGQRTLGRGVHVYVLDSGLRTSHVEFAGRVGAGVGLVNDGWGLGDCHGRGTHIAGLAVGANYGVAPEAGVHPVRIANCAGQATLSAMVAGIDWVAVNRVRPAVGLLGLTMPASATLDTALNGAIAAGVAFAVAAGDNGADACALSPVRVPGALAVAATDITDRRVSTSNWGACVDLFAPGIAISSASYANDTSVRSDGGSATAAAHAAGTLAQYFQAHPYASPDQAVRAVQFVATMGVVQDARAGTPNRMLFTNVANNLVLVRRNQPARTEVHVMDATYQSWMLNAATPLPPTGSDHAWDFVLGDYDLDGVRDVYALRKDDGASGRTEVLVMSGAARYGSLLLNTPTALGRTGRDSAWVFLSADYNRDGLTDIYAVHRSWTNATEVHVLNGATNFQTFLLQTVTPLGVTGTGGEWAFGIGDYNRDGYPDLFGFARAGTPTHTTELYVLSGVANFQSWLTGTATILPETGTGDDWAFFPNDVDRDGRVDVVAVKKANTGTGTTEAHVLNGAAGYRAWLYQTGSPLYPAGSDNSHVFLLSK